MTRYTNPHLALTKRSLWDLILWKMGKYDDPFPIIPMPESFQYPATSPPFEPGLPSAVWIGHCTFLIEIDGFHILTDPVWDEYCSPIPIPALKRRHDPSVLLSDLPPIDCVLISHNHYDHLDDKTVRHLATFHPDIEWIVPLGLSKWFKKRNISNVTELGWWAKKEIRDGQITAVPSQHYSGRSLWDTNQTHWNGYVLERKGKRMYFTGDTGYNPHDFKAIGNAFSHMDLSLIPIGTYIPKRFMTTVHSSPFDAAKIHKEVGSILSLGMHWKTFRLSEEPMNRPPFDLFLALGEANIPFESFLPIDPGVYVNW